MDEPLDCLIIGGGPAGLTAAIYLARFHLDILVVDGGKSRAATNPLHPQPCRLSRTASAARSCSADAGAGQRYGAKIGTSRHPARTRREERPIQRDMGLGLGDGQNGAARHRSHEPPPADGRGLHDDALARGLIRYCPICDGYEVTDKKVGVIGSGSHGVAEALFLRGYTADVTLIAPDKALKSRTRGSAKLEGAGIDSVDGPAQAVAISDDCIMVDTAEGHYTFDSVYPALGRDTHNQLAEMVGARLIERRLHQGRQPPAHAACPASMPPETSSSASIRSAMPWAKAESPRRRSATTSRREAPLSRTGTRSRKVGVAKSCQELRIEHDPALLEVRDPFLERDQRFFPPSAVQFRAGRRPRNSRLRRPAAD